MQTGTDGKEIRVGDLVRSFDLKFATELTGERANYIEGTVEEIAPFPGCAENCDHYHIRVDRHVVDGGECPFEEYSRVGKIVYPPADDPWAYVIRIVDEEAEALAFIANEPLAD